MERSLTVLLPVHNAQTHLAAQVAEILDVVGDITHNFELIIVDDGSSDATSEVAHELQCHYPQVRALRHGTPRGRDAAVRTGLAQSTGELIVVQDEAAATLAEVPGLWRHANGGLARAVAQFRPDPRRREPHEPSPGFAGGFRVLRRPGNTSSERSRPARPNYLARQSGAVTGPARE